MNPLGWFEREEANLFLFLGGRGGVRHCEVCGPRGACSHLIAWYQQMGGSSSGIGPGTQNGVLTFLLVSL